ncbi:MAG TPA: aldo/keto reductase [Candidatus Atribacteria bacterium]|jgi:predicted aldo/keto reductase-like oxidoreductase|nr:aldo/keto reductase [Atribacterota bacterium]HOA99236.1 aldo/keto reductase [Candidatus Atribacteria bacterium]MDI9606678.1 aldo/keto reductase [Atribacterota bacterium]HOQ50951.1 aldo/keto reductase [Candidatus Atribacteria bacterium]HPT63557.1 aldo/keto reductase [Candidatus Atribacteria bacterium]
MQYRPFGKLDFQVSALGFGAMRLPSKSADYTDIDEAQALEMIHYAIDHGVNYLDTAYGYHGGKSEILVGKALKGGYRQKVKVATKLPTWLVNAAPDMDRYLDEQLRKLDTEHIDFYLFHDLNKDRWAKLERLEALNWAEKAIQKGKIGHIGFSFHDDRETFKKIIDAYPWTFCQIQYNYLDIDHQAGQFGLQYAAQKGIAVVIMEPLRGGRLANPPEEVQKIFDEAPVKRSPVAWALLWLWNQKEVAVVLSGMSNLQQVKENIEIASSSGVGLLSPEELKIIERAREAFERLPSINCNACKYCLPCPNGVNISRNFELYNDAFQKIAFEDARRKYLALPEEERASSCLGCGDCEDLCPQELPIPELLEKVARAFEE